MTDDDVISATIRYVHKHTGLPTIRAYEETDAQTGQYLTLELVSIKDVTENPHGEEFIDDGENATWAQLIEKDYSFSVNCFHGDASTVLRRLKSTIHRDDLQIIDFDHGLRVWDAGSVLRLTEKFNETYEPRAQMNLSVRGYAKDGNAVGIANDTLQILGDTASAMGKGLDQAVEAIADASTGEFERLKEFGVKASVAGKQVTFDWNQNGKALSRTVGKNSEEIRRFILENFGARFAGAMDKQSKGWFGMLSNLSDYWSGFQRKIGETGYFDRAKEQLDGILSWLDRPDEDGTLDRWAKRLSDAYVAVLNAGEWFTRRLRTHYEFLSGVYERNAKTVQYWAKLIGGWFAWLVARAFPLWTVFTLLSLVVEDFLTYLEGGDSVIGRFVDKPARPVHHVPSSTTLCSRNR